MTKKLLQRIPIFIIILLSLFVTSCSKKNIPTTGTLRVFFLNWEPEWSNHLHIAISPIEQKDKIIKRVKVGDNRINNIELNPGNYNVGIAADNGILNIDEAVQIQCGKIETLEIK